MVLNSTTRNKGIKDSPESYRLQSEYIVQCARKCFEENGVRKTSLASIAREANITRELIYYYFSGKTEILSYVMDSFVQDAVDTAQLWCETWEPAAAPDDALPPTEMYLDAIASLRRFVFESDGTRRPMFRVLQETGQWSHVVSCMLEGANEVFCKSPISKAFYKKYTVATKEEQGAMFSFVFRGLVGLMDESVYFDDYQILSICKKMYL